MIEDLKFISDPVLFGRHVVKLEAADHALVRSYAWGVDLSGSLDGAGGVGGLVWVRRHGGEPSTHYCAYDGNGNIVALFGASDGSETARYEYGPFGEPIRATGAMAKENPFRFSIKRTDSTTDLVLYEYRVYNPSTGRWLNRDPYAEPSFRLSEEAEAVRRRARIRDVNDYAFVNNDPVDFTDCLGLATKTRNPDKSQTITVEKCEVVILVGHAVSGRPHSFKGPTGNCWAAGFIGCYAKETNSRLGANRIPGSPDWEDHISDKDPDYRTAWKSIQEGAKSKAREICKNNKCCCEEVSVVYLYAPAYDPLKDIAQPGLPKPVKIKCQ